MTVRASLSPLRVRTPLGLFATLWAVAAALHSLETKPLDGIAVYPLVVLVLLLPERLWVIGMFGAAHATLTALRLPDPANHSVLALLIDISLVAACLRGWLSRKAGSPHREVWNALAAPARWTLSVVYLFAVFHKLNRDYFDPVVSCAVTLQQKLFSASGLVEPSSTAWYLHAMIPGTLVVETLVIVLLNVPRTARAGAWLGLGFHLVLGWGSFYDFATVAFALYLFFLPWQDIADALDRMPRFSGLAFLTGMLGVAAFSTLFYGYRNQPEIHRFGSWVLRADSFMALSWTAGILALIPFILRRPLTKEPVASGGALKVLWAIPLLAFVNGMTPYLGLKTVANYSMFSNLRTEGGYSNHLLMPPSPLLHVGYQQDLVRIHHLDIATADPALWYERFVSRPYPRWWTNESGRVYRVPMVELRRVLLHWRQLGATVVPMDFEYQGRRESLANALDDHRFIRPMPWWERRLLAFRAVSDDGLPNVCRW